MSPLQRRVALGLLAMLLVALPPAMQALGAGYYVSTAGRIVVFAIAATSLNLVLGYGGMVSFGHAAFFGLGAYATGVLVSEGVLNAGAHLLATMALTALAALVIGAISLRTRGVYFIMITLAFGQMLYYLANSIKGYGGDEGLNIRARSLLGFGLDLKDAPTFYYVALVALAVTLLGLNAFVRSRFGRTIVAIRDDDLRAEALGFATYRMRLAVFVAAGAIAGIAGALYAHHATYMDSTTFNIMLGVEILVFVVVGGGSTFWGPLVGAAVLNAIPEFLRALREWLELVPVEWTNFYPMNRVYDFLHGFLDFENAKRLIVYGIILILMMIFRPDGLLTRDSVRRLRLPGWKRRHA